MDQLLSVCTYIDFCKMWKCHFSCFGANSVQCNRFQHIILSSIVQVVKLSLQMSKTRLTAFRIELLKIESFYQ